jgi:hypothetical protein
MVDEDLYLEWFVEETFVKDLEREGWITIKGDKIKKGFPDRICFGPKAKVVLVEFKRTGAPSRKGEKLQAYFANYFSQKLGFKYYKITGKEEADELRDKLLKG